MNLGENTFTHHCKECDGAVTIFVPDTFPNTVTKWRQWLKLIRPQVPWLLLCTVCRAWWDDRVGGTAEKRGRGRP